MNHPWQQPIRRLRVIPGGESFGTDVLFIRPRSIRGWEVISLAGNVWSDENSMIYEVKDEVAQ